MCAVCAPVCARGAGSARRPRQRARPPGAAAHAEPRAPPSRRACRAPSRAPIAGTRRAGTSWSVSRKKSRLRRGSRDCGPQNRRPRGAECLPASPRGLPRAVSQGRRPPLASPTLAAGSQPARSGTRSLRRDRELDRSTEIPNHQ